MQVIMQMHYDNLKSGPGCADSLKLAARGATRVYGDSEREKGPAHEGELPKRVKRGSLLIIWTTGPRGRMGTPEKRDAPLARGADLPNIPEPGRRGPA